LPDDGVHVGDVAGHAFARGRVRHAHLDFQPQPCQRRAQVVRDASQHQAPVGVGADELLGHAVEGAVDPGDLARGQRLVEPGRIEVPLAHARGGLRQPLQGLVDEPRDDHGPQQ
jgi:hypothetical protein